MPRKAASSTDAARLDARMAELMAGDDEVAVLIGRDPSEVAAWRRGNEEIDADARVLLRAFLSDNPAAATAALERARSKQTRDLRSEDWQTQGVDVPYGGGFAGDDARSPR